MKTRRSRVDVFEAKLRHLDGDTYAVIPADAIVAMYVGMVPEGWENVAVIAALDLAKGVVHVKGDAPDTKKIRWYVPFIRGKRCAGYVKTINGYEATQDADFPHPVEPWQ